MNVSLNYHQFCTDWLKSWSGNKPENLLEFYTEDAFYLDPANPSGITGQEKLKAYFEKLLAKNPNWQWTVEEVMPTEKGFTLKWKAMIPVHEKLLRIYGLDMVELTGNKISRNEVYFDRVPWMELMK